MGTFGEKRASRLQNVDALLSESSGEKSASALINTGECVVTGVKVITNGSNDVTVTLYDNTEASGKKLDSWPVAADERYGGTMFGKAALKAHNGVYAEMSGVGGTYYVFHLNTIMRASWARV